MYKMSAFPLDLTRLLTTSASLQKAWVFDYVLDINSDSFASSFEVLSAAPTAREGLARPASALPSLARVACKRSWILATPAT